MRPKYNMNLQKNTTFLHLLHIGKTGGSAVRYAFTNGLKVLVDGGHHNRKTWVVSLPEIPYVVQMHPHNIRLRDVPDGEKVIFFLRDPVSRFVSSFYSRKRKGAPRYHFEWHPDEATAFARFSTANELANSLNADDTETAEAAAKAMRSIFHVNTSFWDWFESKEYFLSRKEDIFFIGFQESLNKDFERLKRKLELPETLPIDLPSGNVEAHRGQHSEAERFLEETAVNNLKQWYAEDYNFIKVCQNFLSGEQTDN
ncbi:Sulfotransferase domain-containing protein [Candidatus Electrothrix gigas]